MAQQLLTGGNGSTGQTGLQTRAIINENFTELYSSLDVYRTGLHYSNQVNQESTTTVGMATGNLRAYPFLIKRNISFDQIILEVTTGAGSTSARVCLYADNGSGYPGALVANSDVGTYDTTAAAVRTGTPGANIVLTPGLYWIASNANGSPTVRAWRSYQILPILGIPSTIGSGIMPLGWLASFAYAAMPDPFPAGAATTITLCPIVGFRKA